MVIRELKNKYAEELKGSGVRPVQQLEAINILLMKELLEKLDILIESKTTPKSKKTTSTN